MLGIQYNAPVVLTFSLLCAVVFGIKFWTGGAFDNLFVIYPIQLDDVSRYPTLLSYVLGHADIHHLIGNLSFILLLGPILEEKYGSPNMFIMIIITALVTAFCNIFFFDTGLLGASGIVFMMILLISFANAKSGKIPLTFILIVMLFLGKEIIASLDQDKISQFAHILGGVCGGFFGFSGILKKKSNGISVE